MKDGDIVINTVGPFYRHGTKVLAAAIEAKKNYVDICDDYDATRELLALHGEAKKAGITALINMGSSPGLVNVLAKYAADKLDQTDEINVSWCVHYAVSEGGAGAGLHGYHMINGNVPQFLDGKWIDVPGGSGAEVIEFPGCGTTECCYVGHPEPITLPLYIKGVKTVTNKGKVLPDWLWQNQLKLAGLGFAKEEMTRVHKELSVIPVEVTLRMEAEYCHGKDMGKPWGGYRVDVNGVKNANKVTYTYFLAPEVSCGAMSLATAGPCATGTLIVARVFPPEALEPQRFLSLLTKFGVDCYEIEEAPRKVKV
jgi:saccharopine dehydrogenase (NAD+, L-lysine-forming)